MAQTKPPTGGSEEKNQSPHDSGDDSEDESKVLEESPCGRWQKLRVVVTQRDVPGIDVAYLAMDTEEGREVVWNEVQFSERKNFKLQEDQIKQVFDNLTQLEHSNIVKFYKYWIDLKTEKPRVIFITEYITSGSLKQFLKKSKKNRKVIQSKSWKRWCTQILSALSYLHSCEPPITHANLTCDAIFIQHNGLIKFGSVAPYTIQKHVKTYREEQKNIYYIAPEYGDPSQVTTAVDIYSFGICALEMAVLEIQGNGDSNRISKEAITAALNSIEDPLQKDFIEKCLEEDPKKRITARELLLHKVLFEVHSLKLLAAHSVVQYEQIPENLMEELNANQSPDAVLATISHSDGREGVHLKISDVPSLELEKFLEDVKNGIYPLTAFRMSHTQLSQPRPQSPEMAESVKSTTPEPVDMESRLINSMICTLKHLEAGTGLHMELALKMDDKMNRELSCEVQSDESPLLLATELVEFGFISVDDKQKVANKIETEISKFLTNSSVMVTT
ncbi:nuclear receptor-binding protein-like isoform X2 [Anneissia japonica]|uniref:nuclear receptor-binding protein-like isoform X2 n=1 Tax=Anneissia japonica TaxID=1529436 RepID=UPI0014257416|nr:nuclear receptor-binding protein-like isoform X2 [Anneissia japonica]